MNKITQILKMLVDDDQLAHLRDKFDGKFTWTTASRYIMNHPENLLNFWLVDFRTNDVSDADAVMLRMQYSEEINKREIYDDRMDFNKMVQRMSISDSPFKSAIGKKSIVLYHEWQIEK